MLGEIKQVSGMADKGETHVRLPADIKGGMLAVDGMKNDVFEKGDGGNYIFDAAKFDEVSPQAKAPYQEQTVAYSAIAADLKGGMLAVDANKAEIFQADAKGNFVFDADAFDKASPALKAPFMDGIKKTIESLGRGPAPLAPVM